MKMKNTLMLLFTILVTPFIGVQGQEKIQQPGFYHVRIGNYQVIALSDGTVPVDATELIHNMPASEVKALLEAAYQNSPTETSINSYLIILGDKRILVDAGAGELFGLAHGGALVQSLEQAGYHPDEITDILLTHIHKDHSGGLTIKGEAVFAKATIHLDQRELDFWLGENTDAAASDTSLSASPDTFREARNMLAPYLKAGRVSPFSKDQLLFPGLSTRATYGHTPGHTVYVLESQGEKLMFWGDLIHVGAVQFRDPAVTIAFDVDGSRALHQRRKSYAEAAAEGYLIAADHLSFPGIGRIRAANDQFVWIPVSYSLSGSTK